MQVGLGTDVAAVLVVVSYGLSGALQVDVLGGICVWGAVSAFGLPGQVSVVWGAFLYTCCHKSPTTIFYGVYSFLGSSWNNTSMTTLWGLTKPHRNFKHGSCKLKKNTTKKQLYKNIIQKSLTNIDDI